MKRLAILLILAASAAGAYAVATHPFAPAESTPPVVERPAQEDEVSVSGEPVFEWRYESFLDEDMTFTTISLVARYPDGAVRKREIDTIAGGCNDYEQADTDTYPRSTMIICYHAGLGHYYKVVESDGKYLVQRKAFEEASPDYDPPPQEFETVAQF